MVIGASHGDSQLFIYGQVNCVIVEKVVILMAYVHSCAYTLVVHHLLSIILLDLVLFQTASKNTVILWHCLFS